jgi:hypothetical protein
MPPHRLTQHKRFAFQTHPNFRFAKTSFMLETLCEMLTTGAKYKKRRCVKSKEVKNANKKFL